MEYRIRNKLVQMAKKSSKKQPKQSNTDNLAMELSPTATNETTLPPPTSVSSPSYKPIMDDMSIECLVGLAKDSLPDLALGIVYRHAYDEGYQKG